MVTKLEHAKVYRGGVTAHSMRHETSKVTVAAKDGSLRFSFLMDSKGGGTTRVWLEVGPEDFPAVVQTMPEVDRQAAMAAMSTVLMEQIAEQPEHDARNTAEGRHAVVRAAQEKYVAAPAGSDDAERFIKQSVEKLVKDLEQAEDAAKTTSKTTGEAQVAQVH